MIETDRLVSANTGPAAVEEETSERALRPHRLDDYVGQEKIRSQLSIFIQAALSRREALDHRVGLNPG